jgi:hypothetical protein
MQSYGQESRAFSRFAWPVVGHSTQNFKSNFDGR